MKAEKHQTPRPSWSDTTTSLPCLEGRMSPTGSRRSVLTFRTHRLLACSSSSSALPGRQLVSSAGLIPQFLCTACPVGSLSHGTAFLTCCGPCLAHCHLPLSGVFNPLSWELLGVGAGPPCFCFPGAQPSVCSSWLWGMDGVGECGTQHE